MGLLEADEEDMDGRRSQQQMSTSLPFSISKKGLLPPMFLLSRLFCVFCARVTYSRALAKVLPSMSDGAKRKRRLDSLEAAQGAP